MKTYPKPKQKIQISTRNSQKRYPRPRRKPVDAAWGTQVRYILPANALDLSDDILRLEQILHLMWELNPLHLGNIMTQTQRDSCGRSLRTTTAVIKGWHRTAKDRLAKEYLT